MELESIVANTVYIKAKESGAGKDKGRSRKWKDILKFPHITECLNLSDQIVANSFEYIVMNQPIGKKLFWEFCMSKEDFRDLVIFLDKVEVFDLCLPEDKQTLAANVIADHLNPKYNLYLSKIINQKDLLTIDKHIREDENIVDKNLFGKFSDAIKAYLKKSPFDEFLDSIYYKRYLQWKWLEMRPVTKNTFRMYRILGKGGFGEVCACQVRATGKLYACKKMEKKRIKKRKGESMALNEKIILQKLNSRFIVTLAYAFESKDSLCLVLTIMNGGDLKFHIHNMNSNGFDEKRTLFYAAEILLGLHHLHSLRIVYRDLKPENILIDDMGHLRISDLGLAVEIEKDATIKGRVGTIGYMAPEVIKNERYTFSPDWFGLGCIVYEMIFGESPFRKRKERVKREEVERRVKEDEEVYNEFFTQNAKSICQALLKKDPKLRLGCGPNDAEEVKNHRWFNHVKWKRMEAGLEDVPFVPDPQAVYAKDVLDIEQFSSIKGVVLDNKDKDFYKGFNTGAISIPWQNEIIETECFAELNIMFKDDNNIVDNLNSEIIPPPASKGCCICSPHRGERSFYST